jgi:hypothetical protein
VTRTLASSSFRKFRYVQLLRLQMAILALQPASSGNSSAPPSGERRSTDARRARSSLND